VETKLVLFGETLVCYLHNSRGLLGSSSVLSTIMTLVRCEENEPCLWGTSLIQFLCIVDIILEQNRLKFSHEVFV